MSFPIGSVQWLADKLLQRSKDKKAARTEKCERVAAYFTEIANTLEGMLEKFRESKIPRIEGNQLDVLLRDFDRVLTPVYDRSKDDDREAVSGMLADLLRTANEAKYEDALLISSGHSQPTEDFKRDRRTLLEDLERTIGKYRGVAASLRATAVE
jgi:hypothetical protein